MIDLSSLFEPRGGTPPFEDEFEALKTGAKAMSVFTFSRPFVDGAENEDYREILRLCMDSQLLLIHHPFGTYGSVDVFVLRAEEIWRVQSFVALREAFRFPACRWSDGAEVLRSVLLGYGPDAIASWMVHLRATQIVWGAATIYLVMTEAYCAQLRQYSMRFIPPETVPPEIVLCEVRIDHSLKKNVLELYPGIVIGRMALAQKAIWVERLLGDPRASVDEGIVSVQLDEAAARIINDALESRIEVWGPDGWH